MIVDIETLFIIDVRFLLTHIFIFFTFHFCNYFYPVRDTERLNMPTLIKVGASRLSGLLVVFYKIKSVENFSTPPRLLSQRRFSAYRIL